MPRVCIGRASVVVPGSLRRYEVEGQAFCVARTNDGMFYALDDRCTHENVELSGGELVGNEVECPAHGSLFDLVTGEVCGLPADKPTRVYDIGVVDDELFIDLEPKPAS